MDNATMADVTCLRIIIETWREMNTFAINVMMQTRRVTVLKIKVLSPAAIKKEIAHAISKSLTDGAYAAREGLIKQAKLSFELRNNSLIQGFGVVAAKASRLESVVGNSRQYLLHQVTGGTRTDTAVPAKIRRTNKVLVRRSRWPQAVLSRARTAILDPDVAKLKGGLKRYRGTGDRLVIQRRGKKNKPRVLWILREKQRVKPRFPIDTIAAPVAVEKIADTLPAHITRSLREGARRRGDRR